MRIRVMFPHSHATPVWRIGVLSLVAIAAGAGIFVLARRSAERSAETAELSFDSSVAARDDAAVAHATEPALTVAQSMLTETTVLDLLRQAGTYPSDPAVSIGEFRSRLELQQPSDGMLRVLYRDPDPRAARKLANAVATAIVEWKPPDRNPPPAAQPQIASVPALPVPARTSARPPGDALRMAYGTLAYLEGQLAATDEKLVDLGRPRASPSQTPIAAPPPSAQAELRRMLQAKLAAAHQRLDDLRLRYTDEYPSVESTKDAISDLQQELGALPPATPSPSQGNGASDAKKLDIEIADLRQQRAWLTGQLAAERRAIVHMRSNPASDTTSPPPQTASVPPTTPTAASPVPTMTETASWQNPFRIARLTSVDRDSLARPALLASGLCILFYVVSAVCLFELWRRNPQFLRPAPIAQTDSSFAFDSQVPTTKPPPPAQAPITEGPDDEHAAKKPAWDRTFEAAAAGEVKGISPELTEPQSINLEATRQKVVEAELIEASDSEAHTSSPADAVSEVELASRKGSKAEATEPEPIETFHNRRPLVSASAAEGEAEPSSAVEPERGRAVFGPGEERQDDQTSRNLLGTAENELEPPSDLNSQPATTVAEPVVISQEGVQWNSPDDSFKVVESTDTAGAEQEMPAANPAGPPDGDWAKMLDRLSLANLDVDAGSEPPSELAQTELEAKMETEPELASAPEREADMMSESKASLESEPQASVEMEPSNSEPKVFRHTLADSGELDAAWVARIVEALSRTSSGQMFELERRGERSNVSAGASPSQSTDTDETGDAAGPSKNSSLASDGKPLRITDTPE
jgi:hypothetical protein